jgi:hypothetical protein
MNKPARVAYDAGCHNGHRAGALGKPPLSEADLRTDALASLAVAATQPWQEPDEAAIAKYGDPEHLISEYHRGFRGAYQAAIDAQTAAVEVDRSYYSPPA